MASVGVDTCRVPIVDLTGCSDLLAVPVELTRERQAELQASMDDRIFSQLLKYYKIIPPGDIKRLKPIYLKRYS